MPDMEVNVERLKELRRERVLSLRELEEKSGVSYNTVWRLEGGRAAEGAEGGAGPLLAGAGGEVRRFLQHRLASGGRQTGGAPEDGAEARGGPGGPALRAHQGRLGMGKRGNGEGSILR